MAPPAPPASTAVAAAAFYGRTLLVTAALTLQWFVMFAVLAHVVPYVACREELEKERSMFDQDGRSVFYQCINNFDTDYSVHTRRKIFFLFLNAGLGLWMGLYQLLIARSLWPGATPGRALAAASAAIALDAALHLSAPALHLQMRSNWYVLSLAWLACFAVLAATSTGLARVTRDATDGLRLVAAMLTAGAVITVFIIIMTRVITRRALGKPAQLLFVRLVFHTAVWELITRVFAHLARYIGSVTPLATGALFIWPAMYRGVYGRFLLATLDTAGSVAVLNVQLALVGLAGRVAARATGAVGVEASYGKAAAEAVECEPSVASTRATRRALAALAEVCGVVATAAMYTFGRVSPDGITAYTPRSIWLLALYQALTTLTAEGLGVLIDQGFHGIHDARHWPATRSATLRALGMLTAVSLGGGISMGVEILSLFCPQRGGDGRLLLAFCNSASIFDKL